MKAIMITYDSLNRRFLSPYGCDWVKTPNFNRLAARCATFDNSYAGSLPCMPARRELHTGRLNFLHRSWGPLEPFDDSMPQILKENGIHSHLTSDHYHYWEDGGCTYHTRYKTWECHRGQEGDPWKAIVEPDISRDRLGQFYQQDDVNRRFIKTEEQFPQSKTFANGIEFLENNHAADNWFLHIESFDPHEPFFAADAYKDVYETGYEGPLFDWPCYAPVSSREKPYVQHVRNMYAALVTMCDSNLGKVLDKMDQYGLWEDTMLIVNTDHGFFLGEKGWWGKSNHVNLLDEVAHTPLFIYDPRSKVTGRNRNLVQTIDIAPTILEFFGLPIPRDMLGKPLKNTLSSNEPVRDSCIYGVHASSIACTDGRYVYIHPPLHPEKPFYNYTLMPTHMKKMFSVEELQTLEIAQPFSFSKNCKLIRTEGRDLGGNKDFFVGNETLLFDLKTDPRQEHPIQNPELEKAFREKIVGHLKQNDAPSELYERMGLF